MTNQNLTSSIHAIPNLQEKLASARFALFYTFYLFDHFLQPRDKNTEHKLKIFHLIVYNFYLIISYVQSDIHTHLEVKELGLCSTCQTGGNLINSRPQQLPKRFTVRTGPEGFTDFIFKIQLMHCFDSTVTVNMVAI